MALSTMAGAKFSVSTLPAASTVDTVTEYAALTFTDAGYVESIGAFGDSTQDVTFADLTSKRAIHFAGLNDAGTTSLMVGADPADAGQDALDLSFTNNAFEYAFKIELSDKLSLAGTNTIYYFRGRTMSKQQQGGDVNTVAKKSYSVGINTALTEKAAT